MKYLQLIMAMCLVLGSAQALAWGQIGHRVTGAIAQDYLSKDTQEALEVLFPHESLAEISTYAWKLCPWNWRSFLRSIPASQNW